MGHNVIKVQVKKKDGKGSFAILQFATDADAKRALELEHKPIPNFPGKKFKLNFMTPRNHQGGSGGFNQHSTRFVSTSNDAGRLSSVRSSPGSGYQGKPVVSNSSTQFVNKSHGQSQQQQQQQQNQSSQQPHDQHHQQQHQQPPYWQRPPSRSYTGQQLQSRNQQQQQHQHVNTIFIGNLNSDVDDDMLNDVYKARFPSTSYAKGK